MTTLKLPDLTPAEVSFVGRVVSGVQKRGAHVDEVKRLGDGGLRIHALAGNGNHVTQDIHIRDFTADNYAERGNGAVVNPYDIVANICKVLRLSTP